MSLTMQVLYSESSADLSLHLLLILSCKVHLDADGICIAKKIQCYKIKPSDIHF